MSATDEPAQAEQPKPTPKPFSISLSKAKPSSLTSTTPKARLAQPLNPSHKRPRSALADDADEEHLEDAHHAQPQLLSSFDHAAGGAILAPVEGRPAKRSNNGPLIIPVQKNRDWREESMRKKGKKNLLPQEVQAMRAAGAQMNGKGKGDDQSAMEYGLNVIKRESTITATKTTSNGDIKMEEDLKITTFAPVKVVDPAANNEHEDELKPTPTADEEALSALLGQRASNKADLIIVGDEPYASADTVLAARRSNAVMSEVDAYRADIASRPEPATLDQYAEIPVEEFGAALLRGMGWNGVLESNDPKKTNGKSQAGGNRGPGGTKGGKGGATAAANKGDQRRPALLGIGAQAAPEGVGELGAWGKGARGGADVVRKGGKKVEVGYNPVVLKDSRTGEMITEDELRARKERAKVLLDEELQAGEERRGEKYRRRERDRDRDLGKERDRDRDRDRERDRNGPRDMHRDRERERERDKARGRGEGDQSKSHRHEDDDNNADRERRRRRDRRYEEGGDSAEEEERRRRRKERDREQYSKGGAQFREAAKEISGRLLHRERR
ncbi:hypothetical protein MMC25_000004 [Agyrium rufum]|nr:hypothetical protein [Agyrium rufum]